MIEFIVFSPRDETLLWNWLTHYQAIELQWFLTAESSIPRPRRRTSEEFSRYIAQILTEPARR